MLERVFTQLVSHGIDPNNPRELGAVYLVGGATAFPLVGKLLRETLRAQSAARRRAARRDRRGSRHRLRSGGGHLRARSRDAPLRRLARGRQRARQSVRPYFRKGTLSDSGEHVVERHYSPVHAVGHLRFLECSELGDQGQPAGDLTPWCDLFVPYVPELADRPDLHDLSAGRHLAEGSEQVTERYAYERDGKVRVAIENTTRGFRREFVLGAPSAR
ncbi:MAG: hypothetical protein QM756_28625 [Polyangiaceae bacterium]